MVDLNRFVSRLRPTPTADGVVGVNVPTDIYGKTTVQILGSGHHALAEEGSYYSCQNPAVGTTVAFPISINPMVDTAPFIMIGNTAAPGPISRSIFLHFLRMMPTIAPASGTSARFAVKLDTVLRTPTAGANSIVPQNVNLLVANDAQARVDVATGGTALTVPAATGAARVVANGSFRSAIPVVLEEELISFGGVVAADGAPATASRSMGVAGPIVIPPGCSAGIYIWYPGNAATGVSMEYELTFWQR